jgi:hypothetical protein
LENADIHEVEPRESTARRLDPREWEYPKLWLDIAEIFFLVMQSGRNVVTQKGKEARNDVCFIAVAQEMQIDCFLIEDEAEE